LDMDGVRDSELMYVNSTMAALDELIYAANLSMCGWWTRPETTRARGILDSNPCIGWSLSREQVSSLKWFRWWIVGASSRARTNSPRRCPEVNISERLKLK
jgi:hypothetical protein